MDKIYSRGKRISLPQKTNLIDEKKHKEKRKLTKKKKLMLTVLFILLIAFIMAYRTIKIIEPVFDEVATNRVKGIAIQTSNKIAAEVMEKYDYSDLVKIHKDEKEKITMIETNIVNINKIRSEIALRMHEDINNIGNGELGISMGSFTGIKIFISKGPSVPIRITTIGDIETEYISQFKEAGINQTNHQICLNIKCNVGIMSPFETVTKTLKTQVVLAENVIVGDIPDTYYHFNGLEDQDSLNMIE